MEYILALDTSQRYLAVGISRDQELLVATQYPAWQKQSEWTAIEIQKALSQAGIRPDQLSRIIVTNGPGSYTGIRIALTIAKVFSYSLKIPLHTVSSLQAMAGLKPHVAVLFDARGQRAYFGVYHLGKAVYPDRVVPLSEVHAFYASNPHYTYVGDTTLIDLEESVPQILPHLIQLVFITTPVNDIHSVVPTYLKD